MNYTLTIDKEAEKDLLEIITSYWEYKDENFVHSSKELANFNNLSTADLNKIVKKYSKCDLIVGHCEDCGVEIVKDVYSQTGFKENKRYKKERCNNCDSKYWKNIEAQRVQAKLNKADRFKKALQNQEWKNLSSNELETLKNLLINKTKKLIYQNVFDSDPFDQSVWNIVNKLERIGLVEVMRSDYNGSVNGFDFPDNLYEQLELDRTNEKRSYFSFSLDKNQNKSIELGI